MKPKIFYFVPESRDVPVGGIITLLNHVSALNSLGCEAYAVSERELSLSWSNLAFQQRTVAEVGAQLHADDIVVVPEGSPTVRRRYFAAAKRAILIALSYRYIPVSLLKTANFSDLGFTHVITSGQFTRDLVKSRRYAANLPIYVVRESLGSCSDLFYPDPDRQTVNAVLILASKNVLQGYALHTGLRLMRSKGSIPYIPIRLVSDLAQDVFAAVVRASEIIVVPYTKEGFGRVPLEAMLARCAVATYRTSGPDYLVDGENALVAPDNNAVALLRNVSRLMKDPALKERLKCGGLETSGGYSQQGQNDDLVRVFGPLGCMG